MASMLVMPLKFPPPPPSPAPAPRRFPIRCPPEVAACPTPTGRMPPGCSLFARACGILLRLRVHVRPRRQSAKEEVSGFVGGGVALFPVEFERQPHRRRRYHLRARIGHSSRNRTRGCLL